MNSDFYKEILDLDEATRGKVSHLVEREKHLRTQEILKIVEEKIAHEAYVLEAEEMAQHQRISHHAVLQSLIQLKNEIEKL